MWPMLRHQCPHCQYCSTVTYTPAVFSQVYSCDQCHQTSGNSVYIVSSSAERMARQEDQDLALLLSSNLTLSEPSQTLDQRQQQQQQQQAQPIPIPTITTGASTNTNRFGSPETLRPSDTPALSSSSSSSHSSTLSALAHPPLPPAHTPRKPPDFQQYQYYPSMHYTPAYSAYPSTQSSELMLRRRKEDELARLENMTMERRGFAALSPAIAVEAAADGMDVDM